MTQSNIIAALIIALGIVVGGYLLGARGFTISTAPAVKTISVSAEGKVKVIPDTVVVNAGVEVAKSDTQEKAYQTMNESINQIKTILKNAGIEEKNVQTANLSVSPNYNWNDGKQTLDGYRASQSLTIRVEKKDMTVTNTLLDAIAKVPNITMNGVSYDLADKESVYAEARKMALEKARTKADEMAKVAGVTIAGVESISESTSGGYYPAQNYRMMDMAVGATANQTSDISVGQVDYTATVSVAYSIR